MKKIVFTLSLFLSVFISNAQNGMSFKCGGYSFTVYGDETPIEFSFMAGDNVKYDAWDRVKQIGDIYIRYDAWGRAKQIGNVYIRYDAWDRVKQIGGMSIKYDAYDRYKGSSGSIGCNW